MEMYDIVVKLIGSVKPVGESNTDSTRLVNLQNRIELVNKLLTDIVDVYRMENYHQGSIQKAQEEANKYLQSLVDELACEEVVSGGC
jgi:hypothetical protein